VRLQSVGGSRSGDGVETMEPSFLETLQRDDPLRVMRLPAQQHNVGVKVDAGGLGVSRDPDGGGPVLSSAAPGCSHMRSSASSTFVLAEVRAVR